MFESIQMFFFSKISGIMFKIESPIKYFRYWFFEKDGSDWGNYFSYLC